MKSLVAIGDLLFFAAGYAACWYSKDYVKAAIDWLKAKF